MRPSANNPTVERSVLGAILLDNAKLIEASQQDLAPADFSLDSHRKIYARMIDLHASSRPIDMITLIHELERRNELQIVGDVAYVSSLVNGVPDRPSIGHYIAIIREAQRENRFGQLAEELTTAAVENRQRIIEQLRDLETDTESGQMRRLKDIPNPQTLDIEPADWIVAGMIARSTVSLWTGTDGAAKSYLCQSLAVAAARGEHFLGRQCQQTPVLYVDYENPSSAVRERLDVITGGEVIQGLHIWGTWLRQSPPQIGGDALLNIAKQSRPLLIVDPLGMAHAADENSAAEMLEIMRHLRAYAAAGCAVIVVHHLGKSEVAKERGSSAIRGAVDVAFQQELRENGLITLRCVKNRFGEKYAVTIQPDWDTGTFIVTDNPQYSSHSGGAENLADIIRETPGLTQNEVFKRSGMGRGRALNLLKEGKGRLWEERQSSSEGRKSLRYYPVLTCNEAPVPVQVAIQISPACTDPVSTTQYSGTDGIPVPEYSPLL